VFDEGLPGDRVTLDDLELVGVEPSGLVQDRIRDLQLAEIMQLRYETQPMDLDPRQPQLPADTDRVRDGANQMITGDHILGRQHRHALVDQTVPDLAQTPTTVRSRPADEPDP